MSTTQDTRAIERLEQTRAGFAARYWRAAAYERPAERDSAGWAKLAMVPLALALVLGIINALGYYIVDTYPAYFPAPETPAGFILDAFVGLNDAMSAVLFALAAMYLGKFVLAVVEEMEQEAIDDV